MMHVLIIPSWYPNTYNDLNGVFFQEQAEALAKNNTKVGVIALTQVTIQDILKNKKLHFENNEHIQNDVATYQKDYFIFPKIYRKLTICKIRREYHFKKLFKEYIAKNGTPDIVHLHSFFYGHLAIWIKKEYNIPYVVTEHSTTFARDLLSHSEIQYATKVYEQANKTLAVSQEFSKLLKEKTKVSFDYLPNIVNVDFFKNIQEKSDTGKIRFITIGHLVPKKNQNMLIKAFTLAFEKEKNIELLIVGEGPEYQNLEKSIQTLNAEKNIKLYGKASRKEVKELLIGSDIFVLSSFYETFGVVLIEALSCGLPLVSTKSGGPESIIINEKIGLLSETNEKELAKAMKDVYTNLEKYNTEYLQEYVEENFSEKAVTDQLLNIYKDITLR